MRFDIIARPSSDAWLLAARRNIDDWRSLVRNGAWLGAMRDRYLVESHLRRVTVPVAFVWGERDAVATIERARELAAFARGPATVVPILAAIFGVDPSVITYRLKRPEARGLALRAAGSGDRRFTYARSTHEGRSVMADALRSMLDSAHRHLLSKLEPAEIPVMTRVFARLQKMQTAGETATGDARRTADETRT